MSRVSALGRLRTAAYKQSGGKLYSQPLIFLGLCSCAYTTHRKEKRMEGRKGRGERWRGGEGRREERRGREGRQRKKKRLKYIFWGNIKRTYTWT